MKNRKSDQGFELNTPENPTGKMLNIFFGAWMARGKITVKISNSDIPPIKLSIDNPNSRGSFQTLTIHFSSNSDNSELITKYVMDKNYGDGNISLQAAALQNQ